MDRRSFLKILGVASFAIALPAGISGNLYSKNFLIDSSERIWIGAAKSLWVYDAGAWWDLGGDLPADRYDHTKKIKAVGEDALGRIWVGWGYYEDEQVASFVPCLSVLGRNGREWLEQSLGPPGNE